MIVHVTLEPAEDGWIVAECPALPGCVSQGRNEEEAMAILKRPSLRGCSPKTGMPSNRFRQTRVP